MGVFRKVVFGTYEPSDKNVLWVQLGSDNQFTIKIFLNGKWVSITDGKEIDLSPYLTKQEASLLYQLKGNYLTQDEAESLYQPKGNYLTQDDAESLYQVKGDYLTSADVSYYNGYNSVTTLTNIPVDKKLVVASISGNSTMTLSGTMEEGRELHIIINNTSSNSITITLPDSETLDIVGNSSGEVNIIYAGGVSYIRSV